MTPVDKVALYEDKRFLDALRKVAPGTPLREGLSYIIQGGTGGLIVLSSSPKVRALSEGGVKINSLFQPTLLYELAKMDGAIFVDKDVTKIISANTFLVPDESIYSEETGTRHRAGQRFAQQTGELVIAISQRRSTVTLYVGTIKHVMDSIATLLNKAVQALQTLEKYKATLDRLLVELSVRELEDLVTIYDVARTVQHTEMVLRIVKEIEYYIVELGIEGRLLEMQLREFEESINEGLTVVRDYYRDKEIRNEKEVFGRLSKFPPKELLNLGNISNALGFGLNISAVDEYLAPRGYRILAKTHRVPRPVIENLVNTFSNLRAIIQAPREKLTAVEGMGEVRAEKLKEGLKLLRNQLIFDLH
ncbi:MAG: DNA integrity scanning protein DisA [Candidatus Abyssobacteria bacterium SURF_17]|uniref:DNA integrity scanning protein DisA n=1 Tax=Candidatus Abyssobacteria bacterium SURF_17 TaxID=2093361 RepID=A0A419F9V6_9BACT|nr:MAG: DNA integrity scanning protein DisA [Candidatus Abyssubacteria bacterium SURF_17]